MAENPEITKARERLVDLLPSAVSTLEELLASPNGQVALGAAKDVLDRGGLPAKTGVDVNVTIGLDDEIQQLLDGINRQQEVMRQGAAAFLGYEEELESGEVQLDLLAELEPTDPDDVVAEAEVVEEGEDDAWWQAAPRDPE